MDNRINPQEKSKPINEAKDTYFNEVIRLRSELISKRLEHTNTMFDYTALLRVLIGLITHTNYYLPDTRKYGNKTLKAAINDFISQPDKILMSLKSIDECLKLSEAYITALQEESICSYK